MNGIKRAWRHVVPHGIFGSAQPFFMFTRGRTGSSAIAYDLNQHSRITCHQELMTRRAEGAWGDQYPPLQRFMDQSADITLPEYFRSMVKATTGPRTQAIGFKLLQNQGEERENLGLWSFLQDNSFTVVFLVRDPVALALSAGLAKERGVFNIRKDDPDASKKLSFVKNVSLDPAWVTDEVRYALYWEQEYRKFFEKWPADVVEISYEDYVADRAALLAKVHGFLGVRPEPLPENAHLRVTSESVWQDIENAAEVHSALVEAGFDMSAVGAPPDDGTSQGGSIGQTMQRTETRPKELPLGSRPPAGQPTR